MRGRFCLCLLLVACGSKKSGDPAAQAEPERIAADAAPGRVRGPAPGTWPYVEERGPCSVALLPAPPEKQAKLLETAHARLASVGGTATVRLTTIGDRVHRVDWKDAYPARTPPSEEGAVEIARRFLERHAGLFGVSATAIAEGRLVSMKTTSMPGVVWEVNSLLRRQRDPVPQPVRLGGGAITIHIDDAGRLVTARVDHVFPPVTLCTATLDRGAIERALIGRELVWDSSSGPRSAGKIVADDIMRAEHTVGVLPETLDDDEPPVIAAFYDVTVYREGTWSLYVDPATAQVLRTQPMFGD
jgi:hypothetical protein